MQTRTIVAAALAAAIVSACYVIPVTGRDGSIEYYPVAGPPFMMSPPPGVITAPPRGPVAGPVSVPSAATGPIVLSARLYPDNEAAAATGLVSGTVTNMLNGKGRFQLEYRGEILTGEATVVDLNAHRGAASATGSNGGYMSCEYQLANPRQGAGSCTFSSGARYRLHLGS
jgi:hypothetical protein